ncbi:MAG: YihY/virulence factor BrkB family protein [Acidovorax soli]|uniref:YihY/virulence factor BrkB family protein n=1 Tax=Acidovorax soli TaxID=592050 RepID=UPI0026F2859F|nr:YihY/virulence factor BrkB family protein [Acidovorax soli]MCM2345116.1 YihY/virulence factor BrkB family protein [Acidovorax soli]
MNGLYLYRPVRAAARRGVRVLRPLRRAVWLWMDADGARMSAAMSFYGILSLAPLLVLLVALLGWWLDRDSLQQGLIAQIGTLVGEQGATVIHQALASAQEPAQGLLASLLGFFVLLFGATGVFGELQSALQRLWTHGRGAVQPLPWWHGASLRLRGVAYVLAFGFLLLVSLVISTLLNLLAGWAGHWLPIAPLLRVLNEAAAFGVCAALFVGLMRMSAGPKPRLRFLWLGAVMGASLFTAGRHVLAVYLSTAAVVSAYGAAGSLVVLLMWIYFASAVLLLSAGCARACEEALGPAARP